MRQPHDYRHLDEDGRFGLQVTMREVAEKIDAMNYGAHRFLSHFVDVRRESLAARIKEYRDRGDSDVAEYVEREGDKLADGIEQLLKAGLC